MKIIIWGHKLHSHTTSYVHAGFNKAFKYIGWDTYWFDNTDDVSGFDFSDSLFITEGQVDKNIPKRSDCYYVLHNCNGIEYTGCPNTIGLQTYTKTGNGRSKENQYIWFDGSTLTMCWATDLLPHEIDVDTHHNNNNSPNLYWIGTYGGGEYGNNTEIDPFITKAVENGLNFIHSDPWSSPKSFEQNMQMIRVSRLAPTIVGIWQKTNDYIPCRIFKNISYGKMGITNSPIVKKMFGEHVLFHSDTSVLYDLAIQKDKSISATEMRNAMLFVKENHTYINRVNSILDCFGIKK